MLWGVSRCVGVDPRAAADDVPRDALVLLHVLPPRRGRAARPRADGSSLPEGRAHAGESCATRVL